MNDKLSDILQIVNTPGIGPVTFYRLLNKVGGLKEVLHLLENKKELFRRDAVREIIEKAAAENIEIICYDDERYPSVLRQINDAPPVIYARGNTSLLQCTAAVSIVGARNASIAGRKMASRIAYELTQNDVMVISGMARGIDAAAHKGALYAKGQSGPTIAVLGTGVDEVYPSENYELYRQICRQGVVISELPLGTKAQAANFPRRNRLISALSQATLVVEASLHSGSLITARLALEQGKDIFAVPGSPMEVRASGPNQLIKEGAILTESAADILNVLSIEHNRRIKTPVAVELALDKAKNRDNILPLEAESSVPAEKVDLLDLISYEGVDIDELLRSSGLAQADFFAAVLDLEFDGKIQRQAGNRLARIK